MKKEIIIKQLPGFAKVAKIGKVYVSKGDKVQEGDALVAIEAGKVNMDFKSEFTGEIKGLNVEEGSEIEKDDVIAEIDIVENISEEEAVEIKEEATENSEIKLEKMPGFAKVVKIGKISKKEGQFNAGDVLLTVEGGKVNLDIKAEKDGEILDLKVEEGQEVEKDTVLYNVKFAAEEEVSDSSSDKKEVKYHGEVVILGGGPGGYVAGIRSSQRGKKTIIIEEDSLGGTCLNRGCIPTKSMVQSTRTLDTVNEADLFGIDTVKGKVQMDKIIDRKDNVVSTLVSGLDMSMDKHDIKVLRGHGSINDAKSLKVEMKDEIAIVTFDKLILAPGSVVSYPPFKGATLPDNLTSDELLELREVPKSLIILGGRVIAMEFAFIYRKLGAEVTVIQRSNTIFPNLDADVIEEVRNSALELGIKLYEGTKVQEIKTADNGTKIVEFEHNGVPKIVTAEKLAVATGRKPNLEGLALDKMGVELSEKPWGIKVDDHMKTTNDNIYAIGDATNICQLAHVASKQGLVAIENILGNDVAMKYNAIPEAIFTDPEIGLVGKSEKDCEKENIDYIVGKFPYMSNGKALVENETKGFVKVIADKETRKLIGAALVGVAAADLLSVFASLVTIGADIDAAKDVIYAHPTVSETLSEALMDLDGESLHK